MSARKEYRKDPVSGRWVKTTIKASKPKPSTKATKPATPKPKAVPIVQTPEVDGELVREYLKLDKESPTGLVWAIDNHDKPWLVSYKPAGSVAGNARDNKVNIAGRRIETLRAIYMLQHGTIIGERSPKDGKPLHFSRSECTGLVHFVMHDAWLKLAYGGQRGRRKVA